MSQRQKQPTRSEEEIELINNRYAGMRPCTIHRRIRANVYHERIAEMRDLNPRDVAAWASTHPLDITTKLKTHSNSYEYLIPGVGWVCKTAYSYFKSMLLEEDW